MLGCSAGDALALSSRLHHSRPACSTRICEADQPPCRPSGGRGSAAAFFFAGEIRVVQLPTAGAVHRRDSWPVPIRDPQPVFIHESAVVLARRNREPHLTARLLLVSDAADAVKDHLLPSAVDLPALLEPLDDVPELGGLLMPCVGEMATQEGLVTVGEVVVPTDAVDRIGNVFFDLSIREQPQAAVA